MKAKPVGTKRATRAKPKARRQRNQDPSEREAKDFIVSAIQKSLTETLEKMGFSKREVNDLLSGPTSALTAAVREKLRQRERKK